MKTRSFREEAIGGLSQVILRWGFRSTDGVTALALVVRLRREREAFLECFFQNEEGVSSDIRNKGLGRIIGTDTTKYLMKMIF
jgi:hypothetical protein